MNFTTKISRKLIFYLRTRISPLLRHAIKRLLKRHVQIQSIRDFALPINNIRIVYDSPIMGLRSEEYCGVYEIKDLIVHSSSGLIFFERKMFGNILLEESSNDVTNATVFDSSKLDTRNLFRFHQDNMKSYNFDKTVYLFTLRRHSVNFSHFLWCSLCPLLLLIQNGHRDILIMHSEDIHQNQMEYLEILDSVYGIKHMKMPSDTHFRVTSPIVMMQLPYKKFFRGLYIDNDTEYRETFSKQSCNVTINRDVDLYGLSSQRYWRQRKINFGVTDLDFVGKFLPKDWRKLDRDFLWGKYQQTKRWPSNTSINTLAVLARAVLSKETLQNPSNEIVYITRRDHALYGSSGRTLENENDIIQRFPQIRAISWSECSQREKIEIAYNAKILIGLHGAGLTAAYFMRKSGVVIEIHPRYFRYPSFHISTTVMCEALGLRYIGVLSSPLEDGATHVDTDKLAQAIALAEEELNEGSLDG